MPWKYRHIKDSEKKLIEYKPCFREPSPVLYCIQTKAKLTPLEKRNKFVA